MKLKQFLFLTDENIHPDVISYLRNLNYNIKDVKETGLMGKPDSYLLNIAFAENRVVLTHDSDFGKLVFLHSSEFIGIIYLRPGHFQAKETISTLDVLLNSNFEELRVPFIIVGENTGSTIKVRIKNL